ncbi:serine/arginine repetitive matrix protein 2 isoform X5 [Eleginops maclovinus]|uniref:serine/arginine repetitive matrix protein 2 isoform X5 n=1 Tax=Eleginops maclovinus TaxID=56733 RepID=UPI00307FEB4B
MPVTVPPVPPPSCVPPPGFQAYPPPGWIAEAVAEEPLQNPPPDQPEWIRALISAPVSEASGATKGPSEEPTLTTAAEPLAPPKPRPEPTKTNRALGLLGKRTFDKPPPGRSTGILSFIGPSFGYIEREDLEKFSFSFAAFFGNPKALRPGVRVHFTACKEKPGVLIATDVKVAPGGTENVDTEIYEAVVSQPIPEAEPGKRQLPGKVYVDIGPLRTSLSFERKDSTVTLLHNDQVLINLLSDIVTERRAATNIKPKIPSTFSFTKEKREQGVILSLEDGRGLIRSQEHGELPFNCRENFSDVDFTSEDVGEEVEFTLITTGPKQAGRIRRVNEPLLLTLSAAAAAISQEAQICGADGDSAPLAGKTSIRTEVGPNMVLDQELYEGIVSQPIIEPTWTPLGFLYRKLDSMLDISKERFQGTVLKALSKDPRKDIKKEPEETKEDGGQTSPALVKVKEENLDEEDQKKKEVEQKKEEVEEQKEEEEGKQDLKKEEAVMKSEAGQEGGAVTGRLVTTINGEQKLLTFGPEDMISTATMLDGDKVRFNIATHQETKEEQAMYVEILPDSFEESTEQRRHGLVIELSPATGLIKCSQNPQLYFHMCEVIEKKRLELNEKVEFSVVPHETAEGGNQAIRIKRFTESVFLPARKLCAAGIAKGKMTIKLAKASEATEKDQPETDKMKAVVKNLRTQDSKTRKEYGASRRRYGRSRSKSRSPSRSRARSRSPGKSRARSPGRNSARSRSKSRSRSPGRSRARSRSPVKSRAKSKSKSPPRDQFGRLIKKRRSTSAERRGSRLRRSGSRERSSRRSKSSSRSRSRSRERVKEVKKRSIISRDEALKRRREPSPPPRRGGVVDDELARKKRELEELNDMIAYKKSLVDLDPGQRTCIDYDHGRISVPLTEYKPVRSILKRRSEGPDYPQRLPHPYDDLKCDRPYCAYPDRQYPDRYGEPYTAGSYPDRPYAERPYIDPHRVYGEPAYAGPSSAGQRYTDRYDVYDEPHGDRYYDPAYAERRYEDPYRSQSSERPDPSPGSQSGHLPAASTQPPLTQTPATSSSQHSFRPPSPSDSPPRSPSPKQCLAPHAAKQPLDRFLDMLNKKVDVVKQKEPVPLMDDLLPHERALQDGRGFSRIVGMVQEQTGSSLVRDQKKTSPKRSSVERTNQELKNAAEPYDKIQSLLRTIGLKLSTGDMSKLASRAQEKIYSPKSLSTERETLSSPREEQQPSRTGSVESDHIHSPSPARSSSLEPRSQSRAVSEYEGFLDQKELEALQKAQQLQSLTQTMRKNNSPTPPPGPPPTHFQRPPVPVNWPLGITTHIPPEQTSTPRSMGTPSPPAACIQTFGLTPGPPPRHPSHPPPGLPPGPPPRRLPGQPPLAPPPCTPVFPFMGQPPSDPPLVSPGSVPSSHAAVDSVPTSSPADTHQSTISTTVARCLKVIETVKSLAVQQPAKPVKSVQFSLPSVSPSPSSSQTSTDDDIKNKQKEKLDLYNQRVLEKREQHYRNWLARKKEFRDQRLVPGLPFSDPKNVWICGHSLVYWAESRAKSPEVGMQLGMDPSRVTVGWKGTQGMTWSQLLPQLHQLKVTWPNPDVLIMHLGGNDLSTDSPTDLLASVKKDLTSMRSIFPSCLLVWSYILPRRVWRHSADSQEVDLVRCTVNRRIHSIVSELGGASLTHENIRCGANTGLYRADGVHLSPKGIDVFNLNLQDFLERWEAELTEKS